MKKDTPTKWQLFECEQGRRWTEVSEASYYPEGNKSLEKTGDFCRFSGCVENDHKIKAVGEPTTTPPADWFRAWPIWEESPRCVALFVHPKDKQQQGA